MLGYLRQRSDKRAFEIYLREREKLSEAEYEMGLYRDLIANLVASPEVAIQPFCSREAPDRQKAYVFIRHDVDTARCVERLGALVEQDLSLKVPSAVFVRVDDVCYSAKDARSTLADIRSRGIEVGLHTTCYLDDDYLAALARERTKFADEIGFQPNTFTVHGLGDHRLAQRRAFYEEIHAVLGDYGFTFSDCHPSLRRYKYTIEDCHTQSDGTRFLFDDFLPGKLPLVPGKSFCVLTHPCYWSPDARDERAPRH